MTRHKLALDHACCVRCLQSKKFFESKEKEGTIGKVIYDKGPLSKGMTPCDLGGRDFVASHTEAKKNIVGYDDSK